MFKTIKLLIFVYMIYASILVSLGYARNYEKGQQIITNLVSDDCRKNEKCINSILESELKNSTHIFLLGTLDKIENYLPAFVNEFKLEIQKDLDVKL